MRLIHWSLLIAVLSVAAVPVRSETHPTAASPEKLKHSQDAVVKALKAGNLKFRKGSLVASLKASGRWKKQVTSQSPKAMVLSCADSRVPPEALFSMRPGDLFVNRVAGNVVDKNMLASLEYGAEHLGIPVLLVLGHQSCGAVKAALESHDHPGDGASPNIKALIEELMPAAKTAAGKDLQGPERVAYAVEENVKNSIRAILEESEVLMGLKREGKLLVLGGVYSLQTGQVEWLKD